MDIKSNVNLDVKTKISTPFSERFFFMVLEYALIGAVGTVVIRVIFASTKELLKFWSALP